MPVAVPRIVINNDTPHPLKPALLKVPTSMLLDELFRRIQDERSQVLEELDREQCHSRHDVRRQQDRLGSVLASLDETSSRWSRESNEVRLSYSRNINIRSPISKLPSEILAVIFHHCVDLPSSVKGHVAFRAWFWISHVCSQWRTLAIETKTLWSRIDLRWPLAAINQFMDRAYLVDFYMSHLPRNRRFADFDIEARGQIIASNIHKTHSLRLSLGFHLPRANQMSGFLSRYLERPAPHLSEFQLECGNVRRSTFASVPNLFNGEAPHIRCINITNVSGPFNSSIFRDLKSLSLSFDVDLPSELTLPRIFDFITSSPALQSLSVVNPQLISDDNTPSHALASRIVAPELTYIKLQGWEPYLAEAFLGSLTTPALQTFNLSHEERTLVPRFDSYPLPSPDLIRLILSCISAEITVSIDQVVVSFYRDPSAEVTVDICSDSPAELTQDDGWNDVLLQSITRLPTRFSYSHLHILRISSYSQFEAIDTANAWGSVLAHCHSLTELEISDPIPSDPILLILEPTDETIICPHLKKLTIGVRPMWGILRGVLNARRLRNVPIISTSFTFPFSLDDDLPEDMVAPLLEETIIGWHEAYGSFRRYRTLTIPPTSKDIVN
ncbi:hypothetical protein SISNIDRAFT_496443 [Sistotremastrum niveocremeum HHB9708]|uniref:F-box domain-containing protein n=1 Tax=Sistotremastrum niveocremeum HHB9708 TaxID=1314777 RepID=A0A164SWL3_9AGAM|nr:hypothetical protein SISNIDRAFT_496443 [Sistotremastrum niveocremeum HHB9708]